MSHRLTFPAVFALAALAAACAGPLVSSPPYGVYDPWDSRPSIWDSPFGYGDPRYDPFGRRDPFYDPFGDRDPYYHDPFGLRAPFYDPWPGYPERRSDHKRFHDRRHRSDRDHFHDRRRRSHQEGHESLWEKHESAHQQPITKPGHRELHKSLRKEHRDLHRSLGTRR